MQRGRRPTSARAQIDEINRDHRSLELQLNIEDSQKVHKTGELTDDYFVKIVQREHERAHEEATQKKLRLHIDRVRLIKEGKLTEASRMLRRAEETYLAHSSNRLTPGMSRYMAAAQEDPLLQVLRKTHQEIEQKEWFRGAPSSTSLPTPPTEPSQEGSTSMEGTTSAPRMLSSQPSFAHSFDSRGGDRSHIDPEFRAVSLAGKVIPYSRAFSSVPKMRDEVNPRAAMMKRRNAMRRRASAMIGRERDDEDN